MTNTIVQQLVCPHFPSDPTSWHHSQIKSTSEVRWLHLTVSVTWYWDTTLAHTGGPGQSSASVKSIPVSLRTLDLATRGDNAWWWWSLTSCYLTSGSPSPPLCRPGWGQPAGSRWRLTTWSPARAQCQGPGAAPTWVMVSGHIMCMSINPYPHHPAAISEVVFGLDSE